MKNKQNNSKSRDNRGGKGSKRFNSSKSNNEASKPDKSKGLESHICDTGKSECCVKTTKFLMSRMRQEHDQGNDVTTATEDGKEMDFTSLMPVMNVALEPSGIGENATAFEKATCESDVS